MPKTSRRKTSAARKPQREPARKPQHEPASSDAPAAQPTAASRGFWSGTLSFGLVSIPVDLHTATRASSAGLRMLAPDGTPLVRRFFCPAHERVVEDEDLTRGIERDGEYIAVSDEELEALDPEKSRDIDLRRFVATDTIDPLYFEHAYFLAPSGTSTKAYRLLAMVMERERVAGIATFVLRDREHVVAMFATQGILRLQTLRFVDEVRPLTDLGVPPLKAADSAATRTYAALISKHASSKFDPRALGDDSADKIRKLAEQKRERGVDVVVRDVADTAEDAGTQGADIIDLMRILKEKLKEQRSDKQH